MTEVELVIKIPEKIYESVMDGTYCGTLYQELKNGTPLPKGHRFIDADEILNHAFIRDDVGMSIDEYIAQLKKLKSFHNGSYGASINFAINTMRKYQMFQADYEKRLREDMAAMLTEIQLEIEGLEVPLLYLAEDYEGGVLDCKKIIQKKIKSLKGE